MARISFDTLQETATVNTGSNESNNIKLFSLKNDGDVAIVRIMHDNISDFDILTTHKIKLGDKWRNISCIRDPREPLDNCPLCKANEKIQQRFYIHMIQYVPDATTGAITAVPVVWDRAAGEYATKFKTLIEEYGPLSNQIFKIKRNGKAGDMSTTYEILFGSPNMYPETMYPKNVEIFKDYTALGKIVLDKNYNEINTYLSTGSFPQNNSTTTATATPSYMQGSNAQAFTPTYTQPVPVNVNEVGPQSTSQMPWENSSNTSMNRPVRRY